MRKLIKVEEDLYRGTSIESLFIANEEEWEVIKKGCEEGVTCNFGEISGKHSEVSVTFDVEDFKIISEDQEFIDKFEETVGTSFGPDIIYHMIPKCRRCGEEPSEEWGELCQFCVGDKE